MMFLVLDPGRQRRSSRAYTHEYQWIIKGTVHKTKKSSPWAHGFPLFPIPRQRILGYLEVIYCNIFILVLSEVLKDTMESDKHYVMTYGCFKRDNQMKKVPYLEEHCYTGTTKTKFIQMSVSQWKMQYCWMLMILEKNIS